MVGLFCDKIVTPAMIAASFRRRFNITVSELFISCTDKQLTEIFITQTGIKPGKNVAVSLSNSKGTDELEYVKANISYFKISLFVNHDWFPITIQWRSKSGRIYELNDEDIDCDDIVFSFESLDTDAYLKQLYPDTKLPFKLNDLSFTVKVTRINLDCTIRMQLKPDGEISKAIVTEKIYSFIGDFNEQSEKKNRKQGVIHNAQITDGENENELIMDIDLGSVGPLFFKKLFVYMSGLNCFEEVELE